MIHSIIPIVSTVLSLLKDNREEVAQNTGVPSSKIQNIVTVFESMLGKDEKLLMQIEEQVERARQHDIQTQVNEPVVNVFRGLVRPVITFIAMGWYVYARVYNIPLNAEDYAIVGGVLAFWFGFRPFDKNR